METTINRFNRYATYLVWLLWTPALLAQGSTGTIVGSVRDSTDLGVASAGVVIVHAATGTERRASTNERGDFVFTILAPGEYSLTIAAAGFKTLTKRGVILTAAETLSAGTFTMELGTVTETIAVTAQGAAVQTASTERSGVITTAQVENLLIKSRNVTSLLALQPGVVDMQENDALIHNWNVSVMGNRRNNNNVSLDGVSINVQGNNYNSVVLVSMDTVAEVKILLSNYQAEFGKFSGANVQIVTKSGTRQFHGLGSYFKRHEQFNANNFFNNRLSAPKPRYRFNTWNYNVGGPLYIPGKFNMERNKLFFFWSQEFWPLKVAQGIGQRTVPTELERAGDFSESLDLNNRLIPVRDPTTQQPLPGNRVPANRVDPNGRALLRVFPAPNFLDLAVSARRFNYVYQDEQQAPKRADTLKMDYNINPSNIISNTLVVRKDKQTASTGLATSGATNWLQMRKTFSTDGWVMASRYNHIFSPTLVNEFIFGIGNRPTIDTISDSELERNQRDKTGFLLGQFNPSANPLKVIPNASFGGVTNPANLFIEGRFPLDSTYGAYNFANNMTKVWGKHTWKAGIVFDRFFTDRNNTVSFNGSFDFGRNVNNGLDTGYAYSNAALGVFSSYTESSARPFLHFRGTDIEWFAQDNWKVSRRLTLEFGARFYWLPPVVDTDNLISGFLPQLFDRSKQVQLIAPRIVGGQRVGVHPVTGQVYSASLIGAIAPGVGNPENGLVAASRDSSVPRSFAKDPGITIGPRIGFAYDIFGNSRTALRGGFGMFYNREPLEPLLTPLTTQAPYISNPTIYFGTLPTLLSSSGLLSPQTVNGMDGTGAAPVVMNLSMSVQQNLGHGVILDVGYAGSLGRNLLWQRNLNTIPFGANFSAANGDPTTPGRPLPSAFLRPMIGYEDVIFKEWAGSSNYHSLQVTVNRRFARGLQVGAAWTWSKALDFTDTESQTVSSQVPLRVWNYGLAAFDRTHVLKVNWLYDVPRTPWKNVAARAILNGWQVSGIASFSSGQPLGVGFTTVAGTDITGSPTDGARIDITEDAVLPKGERTFSRFFRTEAFRAPAVGTYGNSARTQIRGPGINNWDTAIFKTFPVRERAQVQFRCEMYNAFNHTQFSAVDAAARFDAQGRQVNARLGELTAARNPRQIQLALRLSF